MSAQIFALLASLYTDKDELSLGEERLLLLLVRFY